MRFMGKQKQHILPLAVGCAVVIAAAAAVLLLVADSAYRDVGVGMLSVAVAAFAADFFILFLLRGRSFAAGILKFWLILLINTALFVAAGVYWFGPVAIFHPHADAAAETALAEQARVSEINEDGVSGWLYDCGEPDAPVILCFYGNGETASRKMMDFGAYIGQGYFAGFDIAVFDYPGYGSAPGRPTEESVKTMALAAYDVLHKDYGTVHVLAYSIGTGAANYVAANRDVDSLALMAPYADGYDLYNNLLPVFHSPVLRGLVSFKMESAVFAQKVRVTPLLLASARDGTVPFESSQRLAGCYENAVFRPVDVADHNGFWQSAECLQLVSDHFKEAAP